MRFQIGDVVVRLDQALRHRVAHAADADPADLLRIVRHPETPLQPSWRNSNGGGRRLAVLSHSRQRQMRAGYRGAALVVAAESALSCRAMAGTSHRRRSGGKPDGTAVKKSREDAARCTTPRHLAPRRQLRSDRLTAVARNAFPFLVVGAIWEIVARAGVFPRKLFPTLEDVARSFVDLTVSGILPHHAIETVLRLLCRLRARRHHRRRPSAY